GLHRTHSGLCGGKQQGGLAWPPTTSGNATSTDPRNKESAEIACDAAEFRTEESGVQEIRQQIMWVEAKITCGFVCAHRLALDVAFESGGSGSCVGICHLHAPKPTTPSPHRRQACSKPLLKSFRTHQPS
ncbi:hypothetical protein M758_2G101600, partial [Ceratodon purpureus]